MAEYRVGGSLECLRCGHTWHARTERRPVQCPRCKSTAWDRPRMLRETAPAYRAGRDEMSEMVQMGDGRWVTRAEAREIQRNTDWSKFGSPGWGDPDKTVDEMLAEIRQGWRILKVFEDDDSEAESD